MPPSWRDVFAPNRRRTPKAGSARHAGGSVPGHPIKRRLTRRDLVAGRGWKLQTVVILRAREVPCAVMYHGIVNKGVM
jgi:hypothetical protein